MTGADRYTDALALLREAHTKPDLTDKAKALLIAEAQVHATLADAAAVALAVTFPMVGDSPEVTEWARLVQPGAMAAGRAAYLPEHWPPQPGDIWQDRDGSRWVCTPHPKPYLACLAFTADDSADEIQRAHGPMTLVSRPDKSEVECPF